MIPVHAEHRSGGLELTERRRVVIAGMVGAEPYRPGATWAVLQYVWGFAAIGAEVHLIEELPAPVRAETVDEPRCRLADTARAAWFRQVTAAPLPVASATLVDTSTAETVGLDAGELLGVLRGADLLVNLAGVVRSPMLLEPPRRRVYVDLDPLFTQVWAQQGFHAGIDAHDVCFTVGLNVGRDDCVVPTVGREWLHTVPPVALDRWPERPRRRGLPWTTVGHWRSYGPVTLDRVTYGQKAHSFRSISELPGMTGARLAPALDIHHGDRRDREQLELAGWELRDPNELRTLDSYERFIADSAGELAVAKHGYVAACTGWVSDRSVCYLASGRPVVALDTGLEQHFDVGDGLLLGHDPDSLADALDRVSAEPEHHGRAARRLAERHFSADRVCAALLART
jgi:hypothetical protein